MTITITDYKKKNLSEFGKVLNAEQPIVYIKQIDDFQKMTFIFKIKTFHTVKSVWDIVVSDTPDADLSQE